MVWGIVMPKSQNYSIRQMEIDGQTRNVREVSFDADKECWNEYSLANGDNVRIKVVVHKIFRVLDSNGNPAFTADGDPEIAVRHQVQVSASGGPESDTDGEVH